MNLELRSSTNATTVVVAKINGERGWSVENKCLNFASFFGWPEECGFVERMRFGTSYGLLPDSFWLRASKNVFKVGSVKFANSLSPPSIVKKVRTGSKSRQGTWFRWCFQTEIASDDVVRQWYWFRWCFQTVMMLQIMILDSDVASDDVFRHSYWFRWCFQMVFLFVCFLRQQWCTRWCL